jgi:hypothetical protein
MNHSSGTVTLDRAARSGSVNITIELGSIDMQTPSKDEK